MKESHRQGDFFMNMEDVQAFAAYLQTAEASGATVEKYRREAARFCVWLSGREVSRELASAYKTAVAGERSAAGINGAVAALNALFAFLDRGECRLKSVRVQRPAGRDESRALTEGEYRRLLAAARGRKNERLLLVMETVCATGIYEILQALAQARACDVYHHRDVPGHAARRRDGRGGVFHLRGERESAHRGKMWAVPREGNGNWA